MSTKGAPMPKREETIAKNPMKLYTYLVCLSGLANYPAYTRMFRHNNLNLVKIQQTIGITNKTTKLYLYHLEQRGLIKYQGRHHFNFVFEQDYNSAKDFREAQLKEAIRVWKLRGKEEKQEVYHIPRPDPFITIPEETLEKLNDCFNCSEFELKLYLLCCALKEQSDYQGIQCKPIEYGIIRNVFHLKDTGSTYNRIIRKALLFLKALNLLDFVECERLNDKGAAIKYFRIKKVQYYISYNIEELSSAGGFTEEEIREILERLN